MGYRDDDRAMYVSPYFVVDEVLHVSEDISASWSLLQQEANDEFDSMLQNDIDLSHLLGNIFFVWKKNHQLMACVVFLGTPLRGSLKVPHKPFGEGGLPWQVPKPNPGCYDI
jgi:hypothetical protein